MMEEANKHIMIAAPTGGGKSYFAGSLMEQIYQSGKPLVILDTKTRNHIGLINLSKMKLLRIKPGVTYDYKEALKNPYLLCIPAPETRTKDLMEQYDILLDEIYNRRQPCVIVVEEVHQYNPSPMAAHPTLELICREGRGYGMFVHMIDQRIQNVPKILWSQCGITYIMKFNIPQDIKYLDGMIPDFRTLNQQLNPHDVLRYNHADNTYRIIRADEVKRITKHYG